MQIQSSTDAIEFMKYQRFHEYMEFMCTKSFEIYATALHNNL